MRIFSLVSIALAASALAASDLPVPETTGTLDLARVRELARAHHPLLRAAGHAVEARQAEVGVAGAIPDPEIEFRFERIGEPTGSTDPEDEELRVMLRQDFEIGGERRGRIEMASGERAIAEAERALVRGEVEGEVTTRFFALLAAQRSLAAHEAFVAFLETLHERARGFVDSGRMPVVELHETERRLGLARIDLRRAESELAIARHRLAATWGDRTPRFDAVVGDLGTCGPLPALADVTARAADGPLASLYRAEIARGDGARRLARSGRIPDFTYGVGARRQEMTGERDYIVELEIELPIFNRARDRVRAAEADIARARSELAAAETQAVADAAEAFHALVEADARRAILADEVLPAARRGAEAQRRGFDVGAQNVDDLIDAHRDVRRAEVDHASAVAGCRAARATLRAILGDRP